MLTFCDGRSSNSRHSVSVIEDDPRCPMVIADLCQGGNVQRRLLYRADKPSSGQESLARHMRTWFTSLAPRSSNHLATTSSPRKPNQIPLHPFTLVKLATLANASTTITKCRVFVYTELPTSALTKVVMMKVFAWQKRAI